MRASASSGAALVVTLIVCTVLAMVVVAMMQNTSLDRASSRSIANQYRAKLAAEAGLGAAGALLAGQVANDHFIVVANPTNGQVFAGVGSNQPPGTFAYRPLFSFTGNLSNLVTSNSTPENTVVTAGVPTTNVVDGNVLQQQIAGGLLSTSPPLSWVYVTNASGQTNGRFAFWIEDLAGRVDLSVAGSGSASVARRPTGTNPQEIALWSLFSPGAASDPGNTPADLLVANRSALLTPASAGLLEPAVTPSLLAELVANLRHDINEPELIPFGFGYADEGRPKYDLNATVSAGGVGAVAAAINANLPLFGSRGGGLAASDYVNNIAANIVDFVDVDSTPSAGPGYRGVEAVPFLNERLTHFVLQGVPVNTGGSDWEIRIETREYLEFWNLHNRTSPAATVTFSFTNNQPLEYAGTTNFNIATNYTLSIPAMPPGSYFVTNTPVITNIFTVNSPLGSPATNPICRLDGNNRTVQYELSIGGASYDRGSGSHYSTKNLDPGDLEYFSASYPGLGSKIVIGSLADADFLNAVGDPRASFYLSQAGVPRPQIQQSWADGNTSFGGRTIQRGHSTNRLNTEVLVENWGDGGHNGSVGLGPIGTTPPAVGLFLTGETDFTPAAANPNASGGLDRITDLGGIFDPLQWGETNQSTNWPTEPGAWTNLTAAATNSTAYAGGHSLRFGRPEFTRFTNDGTRAAQLLDLFAVSTATNALSGAVLNTVAGRININTAGTNSLRALAAGVFHTNDALVAAGSGNSSNFVVPTAAVDAFVSGVTNYRATRPFYSTSQLPLIATDTNPSSWPGSAVFGNRDLMGITAGNDAVTEEWFSRVFPLVSVRSRNFLVHVIGEALQTNTLAVVSTYRATYQVYLDPMRDSSGLTTNAVPRVLGCWSQ